jgi:predicted dinucleotide-binding enzyme
MNIGIIGAGNIGGTLTKLLTALGHNVKVANSRAPETLADLAELSGATPVWAIEAPVDADLVIISIPQKNVPDLAPGIVATKRPAAPVIETNNYYPRERDGLIEEIEAGTPESVWVSEQLGTPVFKVFNGIFWKHLLENGKPAGVEGRIALPIAGDDPVDKKVIFDLVHALGFDPVDGGTLAESWRQQPGTLVYGADLDAAGAVAALAQASPERPEKFTAERSVASESWPSKVGRRLLR